MSTEPQTIFLFSLEPWGDMWYSKHHYAAHLAREHTVYFISLPDKWRWTDLFSTGVKLRTTPEGVRVVEYRNNLPISALPNWLARWVELVNASKLRSIVPKGKVIFWCFHPVSAVQDRYGDLPQSRFIYHVVDPYQNLPNDRLFARRSDQVVAINSWYLGYYSELNSNCILVPHGVRTEDRQFDPERVEGFKARWGRYIILATGLNHFVNYELLLSIARRFSDIRLVIAGQIFSLEAAQQELRNALFDVPNVTYAGVQHPDELKNMIRGAAVGLLTYDFEETHSIPVKAGRTPLKVLTYLAQLCPVVSTNNSYVPLLDKAGYYKAEDRDHFLQLIDGLLKGKFGVDHGKVEAYLDSVEYGQLIDRIFLSLYAKEKILTGPPHGKAIPRLGRRSRMAPPRPVGQEIPIESPIIIISNEGWDGPRYSKHRYALALSAYRNVFFIDPPAPWKPSHFFKFGIRSRSGPKGITILSYNNAIPLFGGLFGGINDRIVTRRLKRAIQRENKAAPLFWSFDPRRLTAPSGFGPCASVYHCADDYGLRWRSERLLAQRCDHVFCIAHDLMPRFSALNTSIHFMPHGLSDEDLQDPAPRPSELPAPPGYGLYIGNINDRHDFELWKKLFIAYPEIQWVIVGPTQVTDPIGVELIHGEGLPNVVFLPPVPYDELRKLIAGSGFGFMFLKSGHPANRISSQKVVQFLAQGKPVFSSWLSEYADKPDLVHMSDDHATALEQIGEWHRNGDDARRTNDRSAYAREQRFSELIAQLPFKL